MYPNFFTYLKEFDVVILIETHITDQNRNQTEKYFPEYKIHWINAKKVSRFGRASGGIFLGLRKSLCRSGIKYEFCYNEEFCGVYIKIESFQMLILPLYIRSVDWTFTLAKLFIEENKCENLVLMGDINVRIGETQQDIVELYRDSFQACTGMRKSQDKEVNANGRRYIDFCNEQNLIILNGQTLGDGDGNFTYVSNVGTSVNDICSVSASMLQYVENFSAEGKI